MCSQNAIARREHEVLGGNQPISIPEGLSLRKGMKKANRDRPVRVHKFGGASLADAAAIARVVSIVEAQAGDPVVVVSAMAGVTDALLDGARRAADGDHTALVRGAVRLRERHLDAAKRTIGSRALRRDVESAITESMAELERLAHGLAVLRELTDRTTDYIVARGERLSAQLVAAALRSQGVTAEWVDATDVIRTDDHFGQASPDLAATDRAARTHLAPYLRRGIVPVIPGFIGRSRSGQVATLGRGGTDLTATLLARALRARDVTLWKDVPGFLTADPRLVPDAHVIPQLTPREAAELAYYGAKILHPRALIPLGDRTIPLFLKPFADPSATGTEVSRRRTLRQYPVKAVSCMSAQALVTVSGNGMLGVPGIAARTFEALHRQQVSVSLISQASSEHSICFSVPATSALVAQRALAEAFAAEVERREIDGIEVLPDVSTLAVVGMGMSGTPGIAARLFEALAGGGISVVAIAQGSSELNISVVVAGRDTTAAVRRIHGAFQLNRIGGGRVTRRDQIDVVLLGFGQIGRTLVHMLPKARQRGLALRVAAVIDRSGYVFAAEGLAPKQLAGLAREKAKGRSLAVLPGGTASPDATTAVREIARHALTNPVLVDLTADETTQSLHVALGAGMDVVLANKRPLAGPLPQARGLLDLAAAQGRRLLHETTVGAGLPIIDTLHKLIESGDRILSIEGCTSGTLGYLLDSVSSGVPFSRALETARSLGYTEPDPRDDLGGLDVARKALILARLIGYTGELQDIDVRSLVPPGLRGVAVAQFLRRVSELDDEWAARAAEARGRSCVLRYVARVSRRRVSVGLDAVPATSTLGGLRGTDNQVIFTTTRYHDNPLVITGPGAGPAVTAAGVLNDVLKLGAPASSNL